MPLDPARLSQLKIPEARRSYDWRDCIIYALGVGYGLDPLDEAQLAFVDESKLLVSPSYASVLASPGFWIRTLDTGIDWRMVVHGEHSLRLIKPLPAKGDVVGRTRIIDLVDKGQGRGALIVVERNIFNDETGDLLATNRETLFVRRGGGFGGRSTVSGSLRPVPRHLPDETLTLQTHRQLALVHRLSGDFNPLHTDPAVARAAGYERPILHGFATYGVASHALMRALCNFEPVRVRAITCRFAAPVIPGDDIAVDIWRQGAGRAAFQARIGGTATVVLSHGSFEYDA